MTNVGARKPVVESLALSTEASRDNTGLEISFAFSVNPEVLACARRWGDPIDKLRANSTAQLNQVCAFEARKHAVVSSRGRVHRCELGLKQNRSG